MSTDSTSAADIQSGSVSGLLLPSLFPDIQWLRVAQHAHTLLLADNSTFSRKSRSHRGKIRTPDGYQWIHIPLLPDDRTRPLASARIDQRSDWLTPLLRSLEFNYRNSIYFEFYQPEFLEFVESFRSAVTFREGCEMVLKQLQKWLEITLPPIVWLSEDASPLRSALDSGTTILMEADSRNYLAPVPGCVYPSPNIPQYRQHFGGFEPNCCWLDLLFERGPESWEYIDQLKADF
jgi:hypothetical protein